MNTAVAAISAMISFCPPSHNKPRIPPDHRPQRTHPIFLQLSLSHPTSPHPNATQLTTNKEEKRDPNVPACPTSKKNHTLPVKLITSGTAYAGRLSVSNTANATPPTFLFRQPTFGSCSQRRLSGTAALEEAVEERAALRINGVVRPHAAPTRRKPRT